MRYAPLSLLIILCSAVVVAGCWEQGRADDQESPYLHLAQTSPVDLEAGYPFSREYAGEVQAHQSSTLGFELAGQVSKLYVNEGDPVTAGQLLASLDTRLLVAEREELQARVSELETELSLARRNLDRVSRLRLENLASEREQDELNSRVNVLAASLDRVNAGLSANSVRMKQSELRAPFDARISRRELDSGAIVTAGVPVFRLLESARREVRAGLPDKLARALRPGDAMRVRARDQWHTGTVLAVGPTVDRATLSRSVRVGIDNDWPPGALAYVAIEEQVSQAGAWLPDSAVTEGLRGTWVVYVAVPVGDGRHQLQARSVIIHHADQSRLFVSGALEQGEQVLKGGLHRYAPGQLVRIEPDEWIADARAES